MRKMCEMHEHEVCGLLICTTYMCALIKQHKWGPLSACTPNYGVQIWGWSPLFRMLIWHVNACRPHKYCGEI